MRLVVDASVALKWFVQEAGSDLAEHIAAEHELIAPELMDRGRGAQRALAGSSGSDDWTPRT